MNFLQNNRKYSSGQALIIVLLVMAVILTSALSITSRSTLDITQTTYEADALRAFSAAEAGVERALLTNASVPETDIDINGRVKFEAPLNFASPGDTYRYPINLHSGDVATVWFVSHDPTSNNLTCSGGNVCTSSAQLNLCWGDGTLTGANRPAIQLGIYKDDSENSVASPNNFSGIEIVTVTADPENRSGFSGASSCPSSVSTGFAHGINVNLNGLVGGGCATGGGGCLIMAKVRMLYNPAASPQPIIMKVNGNLPAQGYEVQSTGTAGESTRKVNVLRLWSEPQSIFNNAIFSYNNLIKS
jgi:hypothetical protein